METRTDEDDDGLLVLEKTTKSYSLSLFILDLKLRDGSNALARRNISWCNAHAGCEFELFGCGAQTMRLHSDASSEIPTIARSAAS